MRRFQPLRLRRIIAVGSAPLAIACGGDSKTAGSNPNTSGSAPDSATVAKDATKQTLTRSFAAQVIGADPFWKSDDATMYVPVYLGGNTMSCEELVARGPQSGLPIARDAGFVTLRDSSSVDAYGSNVRYCTIAATPKAVGLPAAMAGGVDAAFAPEGGQFRQGALYLLGESRRFEGVTGISQADGGTDAVVEFAWRWAAGPYYRALRQRHDTAAVQKLTMHFRRYDDGWRIASN